MVPYYWHSFLIVLILIVSINAAEDNIELIRRLDALEAREKISLSRIADLESKTNRQQQTIEDLQHQLRECRQPSIQDLPLGENNTPGNDRRILQKKGISGQDTSVVPDTDIHADASQRIRQANVDSPVAFLAMLSTSITHVGVKQVIVFDKTVTNVGNQYNSIMGIFTAPVEGIYVFSTTLVALGSTDSHSSFYLNNNQINVMVVNSGGYETTSSTLTLHLQKGDMITVRNGDADDQYVGPNHCSFSGFLVSNYESVQPIVGK